MLIVCREHAKRGTGIIAAGMHAEGNVMEIVDRIPSGREECAYVICEPQCAEDVDE